MTPGCTALAVRCVPAKRRVDGELHQVPEICTRGGEGNLPVLGHLLRLRDHVATLDHLAIGRQRDLAGDEHGATGLDDLREGGEVDETGRLDALVCHRNPFCVLFGRRERDAVSRPDPWDLPEITR